jgi:hypothetical protein
VFYLCASLRRLEDKRCHFLAKNRRFFSSDDDESRVPQLFAPVPQKLPANVREAFKIYRQRDILSLLSPSELFPKVFVNDELCVFLNISLLSLSSSSDGCVAFAFAVFTFFVFLSPLDNFSFLHRTSLKPTHHIVSER